MQLVVFFCEARKLLQLPLSCLRSDLESKDQLILTMHAPSSQLQSRSVCIGLVLFASEQDKVNGELHAFFNKN